MKKQSNEALRPGINLLTGAVGLLLLTAGAASAQSVESTQSTAPPQHTAPAEVNANVGTIQKINLQPPSSLAKTLDDTGLYFTSKYTGQFAANPNGGQRQGSAYAGDLTFGVTFDLAKLVGIPGGSIHVLFNDRSGASLSAQSINSDLAVQNIYGAGQTYQLAILTWEQKLFHNTVDINAGRTDIAFLTSPFYCDFETHGDCGRPYGMSKNVSSSVYPEAVWGGRVLIQPVPEFYGKVGIYQPNPYLDPTESHGFDWGIHPKNGVIVPVEIGYQHKVPGAAAADQYDIGYLASSAPYTASYYDKADPNFDNRGAMYVQAQKMVYQPQPNSPRGIYLFGMAFLTTSGGKQVARGQTTGGLIWQGPSYLRPLDRLGIQVNDYEFNQRYLHSLYSNRLKAGGQGFPKTNQATFEINYMIQMTKWLQFMPNFQYIINPDGLGATPYPKANISNAFVVGLQFSIDLPSLIGITSYPISLMQDN